MRSTNKMVIALALSIGAGSCIEHECNTNSLLCSSGVSAITIAKYENSAIQQKIPNRTEWAMNEYRYFLRHGLTTEQAQSIKPGPVTNLGKTKELKPQANFENSEINLTFNFTPTDLADISIGSVVIEIRVGETFVDIPIVATVVPKALKFDPPVAPYKDERLTCDPTCPSPASIAIESKKIWVAQYVSSGGDPATSFRDYSLESDGIVPVTANVTSQAGNILVAGISASEKLIAQPFKASNPSEFRLYTCLLNADLSNCAATAIRQTLKFENIALNAISISYADRFLVVAPRIGGIYATKVPTAGTIDNPKLVAGTAKPVAQLVVADLNNDSRSDVFAIYEDQSMEIFFRDVSDMLVSSPVQTEQLKQVIIPPISAAGAGDIDGDGRTELLVSQKQDRSIQVLVSDQGRFVAIGKIAELPWSPTSLAVGDLNGDSKNDIAIASSENGNITAIIQK